MFSSEAERRQLTVVLIRNMKCLFAKSSCVLSVKLVENLKLSEIERETYFTNLTMNG